MAHEQFDRDEAHREEIVRKKSEASKGG